MIADAHNDFLTAIKDKSQRAKLVQTFVESGVRVLNCAVFTTEQNLTIADIEYFAKEVEEYNKKYFIGGKQVCRFLLSIEDIGFVHSASDLIRLVKVKPVSVTLTWNKNNQFAGGALDFGGLTRLGKFVVRVLEHNNILVDTAHLNRKSFWQFKNITTKPIYCSHANISTLHPHKRNLTNKQIEAIKSSGGYLGLTIYQDFVSTTKITSQDIANQFKFLFTHFGAKNFGFGTDFFGINTQKLPQDIVCYKELIKVKRWLKLAGISPTNLAYIMYKNYVCFLSCVGVDKRQNKKLTYRHGNN